MRSCLHTTHAFARRRIDLATLARDPFILVPRSASPHYYDQIIATCVESGISPLIRHAARLSQTVVTMMKFGVGVALVPLALARMQSEDVVFKELLSKPSESQVLAITHEGNRSAAIQGLRMMCGA